MSTVKNLWNKRNIYTLSWDTFEQLTNSIYHNMCGKGHIPDVIISIARGGLFLGGTLSHLFAVERFETLYIKRNTSSSLFSARDVPTLIWSKVGDIKGLNVLLADDIAGSGDTLLFAIELLQKYQPQSILTATLIVNHNCKAYPDYYGAQVNDWIIFPWEKRETSLPLPTLPL